ncbi:MAG: peptidylprolyl isomerase [Cytophagaceae bacterium]|jgi:peptidyl-prolyl cis-trans isomerase SurA|nr:peptidylprolyl isomerase [Cytophagaceae bacterium]
MQLKTRILKFITKTYLLLGLITMPVIAQDMVADATLPEIAQTEQAKDTVKPFTPFKLDGVAGVVGDYVVLEFDIDKTLFDLKQQGQNVENISRCQMMESLLESNLLTHQAVQDSLIVREGQINAYVDQQIDRFRSVLGSDEKVVEYYKKESIADLRSDLFEINKNNELARLMSERIIENVEITPEEVRTFFNKIPKDELPTFGVELEIAQIVIEPKASEEERQRVIDRLNSFREDIIENGSSFATKAVLYTDDVASRGEGGFMAIDRRSPLVKEFRDVVFSLQEGEVSEPFETEYGFHIATVEKVRGDKLDIRHILLIPKVTKEAEYEAKDQLKLIKKRIEDGELDFGEAAREFSDDKQTKFNDGNLTNPVSLDLRFELTNLDSGIYVKVNNLKDNEITPVFNDPDRKGNARFKIMTVTNRFEEHKADFKTDYVKIKNLALKSKQIEAIKNWQKEKIKETYIKINGDNRDCDFVNNWLKK